MQLFYDKMNETNVINLPTPEKSENGYRTYKNVALPADVFKDNQEVELILKVVDVQKKIGTAKQTITYKSDRCGGVDNQNLPDSGTRGLTSNP